MHASVHIHTRTCLTKKNNAKDPNYLARFRSYFGILRPNPHAILVDQQLNFQSITILTNTFVYSICGFDLLRFWHRQGIFDGLCEFE